MSVVVRMEIPQNCYNCDLRYECNAFYAPGKPKPFMKGCMIVCQLPEGHGRLVDADVLTGFMLERKRPLIGADSSKDRYRYMQWLADFNVIRDAKTIVPAERSEI